MRGELTDEGFGGRGLDHQEQARLRAELADAQGAGSRQARGDGFTTCREGTFEQDHRVEAAHLGVDRDGDLAFGGDIHEGATARAGTGETDGAQGRVLGQELADVLTVAHEHREGAFRETRGAHGIDDEAAHDFGRARMGVVRHDDDGITRGERGGRVAAGDGIGEREITGAEHRDRAERTAHRAMVRLGQGLAVGVGELKTRVEPIAFLHEVSKETELTHRAADLTEATRFGQRGLLLRTRGQGRRRRFDAGREVAQERGLGLAGQRGKHGRRLRGELHRRGDVSRRGRMEDLGEVVP